MGRIKRIYLSEIAELITKGTTPTTLGYEFQDEGVNFLKIKYFTAADYSEESDLDKLVKAIIEKTAKAEVLEQYSYRCKVEAAEAAGEDNEDERIRKEAILSLESSHSFADTHFAVKKLQTVDSWSEDEINRLCEIALNNFQIRYILTDKDVSAFYLMLLSLPHQNTAQAQEIKTILSNKG